MLGDLVKVARSASRTCFSMKARKGTAPFSSAPWKLSLFSESGR
jgi:hypothetical protein